MVESSSQWCRGELKGDPDIAGIGVVASIFVTTGLTITVSSVLWWLRYVRHVDTKRSKAYKWVLKSAFMLADIQLATAFAIVTSSIILIKQPSETSLYHIFIARGLANCNMLGHGVALTFDTRKQLNWGARLIFLTILIGLYFWWTAIAIQEWSEWADYTPKCFFNDSIVPLWYTDWMILDFPWQVASYAWFYLEYFANPQGWLTIILESCDEFARGIPYSVLVNLMAISRREPRMRTSHSIGKIVICLTKAILLCFVVFPVVVLGFGPPSVSPLTALLFFGWQIYDITVARASNQDILVDSPSYAPNASIHGNENPENDLGFGQLLPIFLLILPIAQIFDNYTETKIE